MAEHSLTRKMLYDLVWSKPMTKAAEELGLSDVGLKKICTRHRVPAPGRGYWAKKDAGKPVKQTRLHDTADPQEERIVIRGLEDRLPDEVREIVSQERARRKQKSPPIIETEDAEPVSEPHPAILATARILRSAKPANGVVRATGQGTYGIDVGVASVERVVAILDGIARGLEARGLVLTPTAAGMSVTIAPDNLSLSVSERIEARKHVPTLEELAAQDRLRKKEEREVRLGNWSYSRERAYPEFDYIRTGELGVQIADQYVYGLRRSWKDGKRQRLEALIEDIAGGLVAYLAGVKARREEGERRAREWQRQQDLRARAQARQELEERRVKFLQDLKTVSAEMDALESSLSRLRPTLSADAPGELQRLMEWSEARLESLRARLSPEGVAAALRKESLFPEIDDLADPETPM